jgi:HEAT repeat protein
MARLVIGIVLILFFVAGLFGEPPSMPAYLAVGSALFLLPGVLCVVFGLRKIRLRPAGTPPSPVAQQMPPQSPPSGWYPDPTAGHQQRFWDGTAWTAHVTDDGQTNVPPPAAQPGPVDDEAAREYAVKELARIGDPSVIPALREALGDSSYGVRTAASEALEKMGLPAINPLLQEALDSRSHVARSEAIEALGKMGPAAFEPLVQALQSAEDETVRKGAAQALGQMGDARAVDALIEARRGSFTSVKGYRAEVPAVSQAAVWALGQIGDPRAIGPLADVAQSGTDSVVGWSVTQAIAGIRNILASRLSEVSDDALREVAALDDVVSQPLYYEGYGGHEMVELRNHVDCSDIQQIARQELARRGSATGDEAVRETQRAAVKEPEPAGQPDVTSSAAFLGSEDHEQRKAAITALRTSGVQDPEEPRTVLDLTDPQAGDAAALDRELRDHPDFDVAYVRAAYPTGLSEDHEHADPAILREGLATCRRKSYLLARLSSYCTWHGDALAALDHAVAAVLLGDPSQGPGDMVQVMELLTVAFRKTGHLSEAVVAAGVQASYALGATEAAAVEKTAAVLADLNADEVSWAADALRERLTSALADKRQRGDGFLRR